MPMPYGQHRFWRWVATFLLPFYWARGDDAEAERVKSTVLIGSLVPHVLCASGMVIIAITLNWEDHVRDGLLTVAVIVVLVWYHRYLIQILQGRQTFGPGIRTNYIAANLGLFLGAPLIYLYGIYGIYATAITTEMIVVFSIHKKKFSFQIVLYLT